MGGGQAALALSYHLRAAGREHVLLERGRVAERWRSERWDSLVFQFPNWTMELPGQRYAGDDPEGFAPRDEVVAFLERYAQDIRAPLRTGVCVTRVETRRGGPGFLVRTTAHDGPREIRAVNVVMATGPYQRPALPLAAAELPADILQVHSSTYRNPGQLPAGGVLVIGSGASGCQIAEDLLAGGRPVFLSVGRHRRIPRRYRGRDIFWWLGVLGRLDQTVDENPRGRHAPNPLVTGAGGGPDIDLRDYAAQGVTLLGHVVAARGARLALRDDIAACVAEGDLAFDQLTRAIDDHLARSSERVPAEVASASRGPVPASPFDLDLRAAGITSVVWATGFAWDFGWIACPAIFDTDGRPIQRRGATPVPGLFFLGLPWLHTLTSSVLCGVGADAAHVAELISRASA